MDLDHPAPSADERRGFGISKGRCGMRSSACSFRRLDPLGVFMHVRRRGRRHVGYEVYCPAPVLRGSPLVVIRTCNGQPRLRNPLRNDNVNCNKSIEAWRLVDQGQPVQICEGDSRSHPDPLDAVRLSNCFLVLLTRIALCSEFSLSKKRNPSWLSPALGGVSPLQGPTGNSGMNFQQDF